MGSRLPPERIGCKCTVLMRPVTFGAVQVLLSGAFALAAVAAAGAQREENVFLFGNRKVAVAVPAGLGFASNKDDRGLITVRIGHPQDKISAQITFLPDPDGQYATARARKEFMNENFQGYVGSSVEKAMQFEELEPRVGAGTYCIFTDASLVGKTSLPPGEFLHSTAGLKTWPGIVAIFSVFSNETTSKDYQAVMKMLRESVQEKPVPLR